MTTEVISSPTWPADFFFFFFFFFFLSSRFTYRKLLRITRWILRFKQNRMVSRLTGPLQTQEIECAEKLWINIIQETTPSENHINKIMDNDKIWRINSRIHGYSPILPPRAGRFHEKVNSRLSLTEFTWGSASNNVCHT